MKLRNVHNDKRGEIHVIDEFLKDNKEITLIHTNKGFARGGGIHKYNTEHHTIVEGKMKYIVNDEEFILNAGDSLSIDKGIPHYCIALENSITIQFGTTPIEQQDMYGKFRKIVDEINDKCK